MNTAKKLMKQYADDVIKMQQKAEDLCNEHKPFWDEETDIYYFNDGSLLWFNSHGEYGDTKPWYVLDIKNGKISRGFKDSHQALGALLDYLNNKTID